VKEKNQSNQNIGKYRRKKRVIRLPSQQELALKTAYSCWNRHKHFPLFVTLKFIDGDSINDDWALQRVMRFLNMLDRRYIKRKDLREQGIRIERMTYVEHGISGENTHFHIYISKPQQVSFVDFKRVIEVVWNDETKGTADVRLSDGGSEIASYTGKEIKHFSNTNISETDVFIPQASYTGDYDLELMNKRIWQNIKTQNQAHKRLTEANTGYRH